MIIINSGIIPSDNHFITPFRVSNVDTSVLTVNTDRLFYIPIRIPIACRIIEMGVNVGQVASASQKMVMGIYDFDIITGNPINLLAQAIGEIELSSGTGYLSIPIELDLDPGIYYIVYNLKTTAGTRALFKTGSVLSDPILPFLSPTALAYTTHKFSTLIYNPTLPTIAPAPTSESTSLAIPNPILKTRVL